MAKKKAKPVAEETYEYINATVMEGDLSWRYKLAGKPPGSMRHDEHVAGWSREEIVKLTAQILDVPAAQVGCIDVEILD